MWTFIKNIVAILAAVLPKIFSKEREKAKEIEKDEAVEKAIVEKDKEAVNRAFKDVLKVVILALILFLPSGCSLFSEPSRYTVIPADREIKPMTHEGVKGWFFPDAVVIEIYQKLDKAKESEE